VERVAGGRRFLRIRCRTGGKPLDPAGGQHSGAALNVALIVGAIFCTGAFQKDHLLGADERGHPVADAKTHQEAKTSGLEMVNLPTGHNVGIFLTYTIKDSLKLGNSLNSIKNTTLFKRFNSAGIGQTESFQRLPESSIRQSDCSKWKGR
jgi:hypothetical protein